MNNKEIQLSHIDARENISYEFLLDLESSPDPFIALDKLKEFDVVKVCAILDAMSDLGGALLIGIIKFRIEEDTTSAKIKDFYLSVITRAEELDLDVLKGLNFAWIKSLSK